jgi:hypothetical protein
MKKIIIVASFILLLFSPVILSQSARDTSVYLITCGTGAETYSIYGHSALRVYIPEKHADTVFNWGVFNFDTPNFIWKFAKGRLDYMLASEPLQRFLQEYYFEKRFVHSQNINLNAAETAQLLALINENMKPENKKYRYDFFYDDCSTRIRDLLEKCTGGKLLYPPAEKGKVPTFREMVGKYQSPFPWLKFGVDLIMGSPGDKKAFFRDRMFLPLDMQNELSEAVINRSGRMIPLLQNPEVILNFDPIVIKQNFFTTPAFIFTLLLIVIVILSASLKSRKLFMLLDIFVFSIFAVLAILMIFFNFFTDHQQMKLNLNIIWLNPVIIICLAALILNKPWIAWYRILFYLSATFLVIHFILPQDFNIAIIPLVTILTVRCSVRSGFEWNPFKLINL